MMTTTDVNWVNVSSGPVLLGLFWTKSRAIKRLCVCVKEGPADCIRIDEVAAALKKMKRHKAPGFSGLVAGMVRATGDVGTHWILDLCNSIVKEVCIPQDWKSSMVLPIYKGKGGPMECRFYRGIKLFEHVMKVVKRIFEYRIRQQIEIDDMQFRFMKGKGTTGEISIVRQMQ